MLKIDNKTSCYISMVLSALFFLGLIGAASDWCRMYRR